MTRVLVSLLLFVVLVQPAAGQEGTRPVGALDLLRIAQITDVAASPNGRDVVYVLKTIARREDAAADEASPYAYQTNLWIASPGEPPRPLTYGEAGATSPAWHPSGDRVAFVRERDGAPQVWELSLLGGEPRRLTRLPHGATAPAWSPDGERLLVASALPDTAMRRLEGAPVWDAERPARSAGDDGGRAEADGTLAQVRAYLRQQDERGAAQVINRLDFQGETGLEPAPSFRQLYVVEPASGRSTRITPGYRAYGDGAWAGDDIVVASRRPDDRRHPDRVLERELVRLDAAGGGAEVLLRLEGERLGAPTPTPDGRHVAFTADALTDLGFPQTEIGIVPIGGGAPEWLTDAFDYGVSAPLWSADGWHLYFTAAMRGGVPLFRIAPFDTGEEPTEVVIPDTLRADTLAAPADAPVEFAEADTAAVDTTAFRPSIEQLSGLESGVRAFSPGRASVYYVLTTPQNPYELYRAAPDLDRARRLTDHNARWLAERRLAPMEPGRVVNDSLEIDYWVVPPAFTEPGRRYPLLLAIHGGPMAMWGPGEATMWHEFQYLAARGYGIVFANPRGSGGYGRAFMRANYADWGDGPAADVLAALEEAAERPWVDPEQLFVAGGSYAGYLTAWIVAHDQRFRAAVAQRGVYDLPLFLGEGNAWRLVETHFGGFPWDERPVEAPGDDVVLPIALDGEGFVVTADALPGLPDSLALASAGAGGLAADSLAADSLLAPTILLPSPRELLDDLSPLRHAHRIETPLLIMHGDRDLRTGVSQSEALYRYLKILDRPVEYVRYPEAGHDLSRTGDPAQRIDRLLRIYEFLARYTD